MRQSVHCCGGSASPAGAGTEEIYIERLILGPLGFHYSTTRHSNVNVSQHHQCSWSSNKQIMSLQYQRGIRHSSNNNNNNNTNTKSKNSMLECSLQQQQQQQQQHSFIPKSHHHHQLQQRGSPISPLSPQDSLHSHSHSHSQGTGAESSSKGEESNMGMGVTSAVAAVGVATGVAAAAAPHFQGFPTDSAKYGHLQQQQRLTLQELENALFEDDEESSHYHSLPLHTPITLDAFNDFIISPVAAAATTFFHSNAIEPKLHHHHHLLHHHHHHSQQQQQQQQEQQQQQQQQQLLAGMSNPEQLLVLCAEAISNNDLSLASEVMTRLNQVVSILGDPMQRLAAYMVEGLMARIESSGRGIYRSLKCKEPPATDLLSAMQILYEVCPYFKFGYMAANGAIAEAFKDEAAVHIIDFEIAQGTQWISLIQALAARPGGPPTVRITGIGDPDARIGGLEFVGARLKKLAESVNVPLEFHPLAIKMSEFAPWMLHKNNEDEEEEAVAVNFALQLHHLPDENRDRLLRIVKGMNPKVVTLVEQEANTNTAPFFPRFMETLRYYSAVFESLDVTLPRESRDRVNVEQNCLARDIVNIIACEGSDRIERHELIGKWRARMTMAGFKSYPLSPFVNHTINSLLQSYCSNYRLIEDSGGLHLGWLRRCLIVASAWC